MFEYTFPMFEYVLHFKIKHFKIKLQDVNLVLGRKNMR